ncbi:MAG: hypothetical protein J5662_08580, partial [Clostridia bacterium]|nr:hypothetical protein [Clostridia bacterium]
MKKKILSLTLAICIALSLFAGMTFNVGAETVSGKCGDNLTWQYNSATQTLTIAGTGEMNNYSYSAYNHQQHDYATTAPWRPYYKSMKSLVINNGITSIGNYAFYGCTGLTSIT